VSVKERAFLCARLTTPSSGVYFDPNGGILGDETQRISVHMICTADGMTTVVLTLLFESGSIIELGFVKQCEHPKVMRRTSSLWRVASNAFWISVFILVCANALGIKNFVQNLRETSVRHTPLKYAHTMPS